MPAERSEATGVARPVFNEQKNARRLRRGQSPLRDYGCPDLVTPIIQKGFPAAGNSVAAQPISGRRAWPCLVVLRSAA